jgi:hypothetical protein
MTLGRNFILAITLSKVFSEILFSKAIFLKSFFHARKPVGFSDKEEVEIKKINISK